MPGQCVEHRIDVVHVRDVHGYLIRDRPGVRVAAAVEDVDIRSLANHLTAADRVAAGSYAGCIAGALSRTEYLDGLAAAGFTDASVTFTHEAAPGMHSAIIRAVKPATA